MSKGRGSGPQSMSRIQEQQRGGQTKTRLVATDPSNGEAASSRGPHSLSPVALEPGGLFFLIMFFFLFDPDAGFCAQVRM